MASSTELNIGQKLNEGKTKQIFELVGQPGLVLVQSKDQITAGNAVRKDQMEGKAAIANKTTCCVFKLLQESGIKTAFVKQHSETAFIAAHCEMIPIEWDDANNDPQWSEEQLLAAKFSLAGLTISQCEVDIMNRSTVAIFEILEKAWATQNCTLVDMKACLGCSTVLSPDAAAQFAAQVIGLSNHLVWSKLRASMLNTWVSLKLADQKLQACSL
ncbi:hypothetical protein XENOCAPTIV_012450 [Xenoophorus captivus]|uniref:phosphoribosylaminoimidazolesuccinocarboxamide synthase n=1 Tax=Xenoophorus captivus TaxID=1517983 RepID=A0ABV0SC30_9TELE